MRHPLFHLLALSPFALSAALGAAASASTVAPPAPAPVVAESPREDLPAHPASEALLTAVAAAEPPAPDSLPDDAPPRVKAAALPAFEDDLPEGKSAAPIWKEWKHATEFQIPGAPLTCRARRVREWVRVECDLAPSSFVSSSLIAGQREGVSFGHNELGQGYDVVFPVRRGDRRVFQILEIGSWSKYSVDHDAAFVISEAWLPGAPSPVITVD